MNLIYDAPISPKVFTDTTVLCGALRVDGESNNLKKRFIL